MGFGGAGMNEWDERRLIACGFGVESFRKFGHEFLKYVLVESNHAEVAF